MGSSYADLLLYAVPLAVFLVLYFRRRGKHLRRHEEVFEESRESGLSEPVSLHPVIDPLRCIGSSSCVRACPEGSLGIIDGKARLVNPSACIGHGACMASCPMEAIKLVFGTEKRGVDIPFVTPHFETNIPGIFIAGELGGMGLVRKAAEQGKQAMDAIRALKKSGKTALDVLIVGSGPAGIAAGLGAIQDGKIDWNMSALEIWRRVRAFNPWPGTFTTWQGKIIKVVESVPFLSSGNKEEPGTIIKLSDCAAEAGVVTGNGVLGLIKIQLEGKRPMAANEFLRGYKNFIGSKLI